MAANQMNHQSKWIFSRAVLASATGPPRAPKLLLHCAVNYLHMIVHIQFRCVLLDRNETGIKVVMN